MKPTRVLLLIALGPGLAWGRQDATAVRQSADPGHVVIVSRGTTSGVTTTTVAVLGDGAKTAAAAKRARQAAQRTGVEVVKAARAVSKEGATSTAPEQSEEEAAEPAPQPSDDVAPAATPPAVKKAQTLRWYPRRYPEGFQPRRSVLYSWKYNVKRYSSDYRSKTYAKRYNRGAWRYHPKQYRRGFRPRTGTAAAGADGRPVWKYHPKQYHRRVS
ncbi:MAG: hypothetical protein ACE5EX_02250 [Phycisphaerae bacterium]